MLFEISLFFEQIKWDFSDYVIFGTLFFAIASACIYSRNKVAKKYQLLVLVSSIAIFLWLWAELAVGVFTSLGH
ncbi:hypothetical protein [Thalassotalea aquiviva]|uniref:hypothetical protein n=1 Tax=Thalassotalea aquiviva TaxID=3242415 RepID=UPI00352B1A65